MMRYTLAQEQRVNTPECKDVWEQVHIPLYFTTQVALETAFKEMQRILPAGHRLVGKDNKNKNELHFTYCATTVERYEHRINDVERTLKSACKEVITNMKRVTDSCADPKGDVAAEMGWLSDTFRAGARVTVCRAMLFYINKVREAGLTVVEQWREMYNRARAEVQQRARFPSHSTSETANLKDQEMLGVWADMVERFENMPE